MKNKTISFFIIFILVAMTLVGCKNSSKTTDVTTPAQSKIVNVVKDGKYSKPDEVAQYIRKYQQLPKNYLTKKEATASGWDNSKGNLWKVTDKMSIGGDIFGNHEGKLPKAAGRKWYECDVNYYGGFRGAERLLYSNDNLIYYTNDHYNAFVEFQGEKR